MACDPAHIGTTPIHIVVFEIKDPFGGHVGVEVIAACGVNNPLGFARGAAGVEDEEHIFGVHRFGRTVSGDFFLQIMPPMVAPCFHVDGFFCSLNDQDIFDAGGMVIGDRRINLILEGHCFIFAEPPIGSNHQFGFGIFEATAESFGTKPPKDHSVGRTNPRTGEEGNDGFGDHWHINSDAIAFFDPQFFHGVGELTNLMVQLGVGEGTRVTGFPFPDEGGFIFAPSFQVAIEAVMGNVDLAVDKPFCEGRLPIEHLIPFLKPFQLLFRQFTPKAFRITFGPVVKGLVLV